MTRQERQLTAKPGPGLYTHYLTAPPQRWEEGAGVTCPLPDEDFYFIITVEHNP